MNDEPDQVEASAHGQPLSALCERLFRRHAEPIGIINVREAERLYERIIGWIAGRYNLLEQLMNRYRMDDLGGDGQPFILEQSFWEMVNASSAPAPSGSLPSQTVSFPPVNPFISSEVYSATPIKPSAAPPLDSSAESMPTSATKFRVSRRPPPVSNMEQSDDWQSGGSAALKSAEASHQTDERQSTTEAREVREPASSITFQSSSSHQQMNVEPESGITQMPLADAARPMNINASPTRQSLEESQATDDALTAKPSTIAREITGKSPAPLPFSDPLLLKHDSQTQQPTEPQLELAQSSQPHPPEGKRQNADEGAAKAERNDEVSSPSLVDTARVDAARLARTDQAATEQFIASPDTEESQATDDAPTAKRPPVAREITSKSPAPLPFSDPLLLKDDSPTQQSGEPQSTPAQTAHEPIEETRTADAVPSPEEAPTAKPSTVAREIRQKADAARPARIDQVATEQFVASPDAEESQAIEHALTAKHPPVAREIISKSPAPLPLSDPLLLMNDSQSQQPGEPQSTSSPQSDRVTESYLPNATAESAIAPSDDLTPAQVRTPVSPQDSSGLQSAGEIKQATRQAEPDAAMEMARASRPAQTAQRDALSSPSRSQAASSKASPSRPPMATEMQGEPVNSTPVDFIWREGDDAAAEIHQRQSGFSAPSTAHDFHGSASTSSSSLNQRAVQPPTQEQSNQVNLEKIPDHVINTISQQVIRALSRILTVERERKGIR